MTGLTFFAVDPLFVTVALMHRLTITDACTHTDLHRLCRLVNMFTVLQHTATVAYTNMNLRLARRNLRLPKTQLKRMRRRNKSPDVPENEARKQPKK